MSFGELAIILIISLLIFDIKDIKLLVKKIMHFRRQLLDTKTQLLKNLEEQEAALLEPNELDQLNFYLQKIAELNENYQGEYNLSAVKDHYYQLLKVKSNQQ